MKGGWALIGVVALAGIGVGSFALARHAPVTRQGDLQVALDQSPHALAIDTRTGHTFVAMAGLNGIHAHVVTLDTRMGALLYTASVGSNGLVVDPRALVVDSETGRVLEVNGDTTESILDARSGHVLRTLAVGNGLALPQAMALSERDGRAFVLGVGGAARLSILDARSGGLVRTIPLDGRPQWLAVAPRTHHLFVSSAQADEVATTLLDANTGHVIHAEAVGGPIAVDERTGHAFVANAPYYDTTAGRAKTTHTVSVLDVRTGRLVRTIQVGANPSAVAVDAVHGRVVVAMGAGGMTPGKVAIVDAATGRLLHTASVGWNPAAIAIDARHGRIVVANAGFTATNGHGRPAGSGSISVLAIRSGRVLRTIQLQGNPQAVAVDERNGRAVVATQAVVPCSKGRGRTSQRNPLDTAGAFIAHLFGRSTRPSPCGQVGSLTLLDMTR